MAITNLNQQLKRIEISSFELDNEIVFNYLDNLSAIERDEKLIRAIYIGVLALMEDRISSFLAKTSNELGTELESLKMIFEMKKELFYKSAVKGILAEEEVADFLNEYFKDKRLKDVATLTGNTIGNLPRNKTGDIVCEVDGNSQLKIVIECKFDKNVRLGEIENYNLFSRANDTAWSQLIEAQANREAKISLIIFDASLVDNSILRYTENVGYIPEIGLVSIIDSQKGDYSNLVIAYMLARDIAKKTKEQDVDQHVLSMLISRLIAGIEEILKIRSLVETNIQNNREILKQLEKSMLLMEFNQKYLSKFLKDGKLNKEDLLDFYTGKNLRKKYSLIEEDINQGLE